MQKKIDLIDYEEKYADIIHDVEEEGQMVYGRYS